MVQETIYFGYVFEEDGTHYGRIELKASDYKLLARFITDNPGKDKMITDILDLPVIVTCGPFVDRLNPNEIDRELLMKELTPLLKALGY